MRNDLTIHREALVASPNGLLLVEQFLQEKYLFRRNVLSGKVEFVTLPVDGEPKYRELTPEAEMNDLEAEGLAIEDVGEGEEEE